MTKNGAAKAPETNLRHFALPCPFCGRTDLSWMRWCECRFGIMHNMRQQDPRRVVFAVECKCGAKGPIVRPSFVESQCRDENCPSNATWVLTAQTAWEAWNVRHPSPGKSRKYGIGCPFCGDSIGLTQYGAVLCSSCGAEGPEPEKGKVEEPDEKERGAGRKLWAKRARVPASFCLGWGNPPKKEWEKYDWPPGGKARKHTK